MNSTPISSIRPVTGTSERSISGPEAKPGQQAPARPAVPDIAVTSLQAAEAPPVDAERVDLIRKAIANGTYPILPAKIADAMIAAGILLRTRK